MTAKFVAPDDSKHKIEILGDGQQVVVDGIHPDTKQPYRWHGGWPGAVQWAELPELTEKEAAEFLALATDMLCERFGFKQDEERTNGHADPFEAHGAQFKTPLDVEAELDTLIREGTGGGSVNDVLPRVIASMLRHATHPHTVRDVVTDAAMAMAERLKLDWTREKELRFTNRRINSAYRNLLLKEYDFRTGEIPAWLPEEFQARWAEILTEGRRPDIGLNPGGFYVRSWAVAEEEKAKGDSPPGTATEAKPRGWNYFDESKSQQPSWLVKGLLPETGVGILAGQWGSFKTTVALELSVSVMTTAPFAGQYKVKRRGAVLYLASEGGATVRSRLAALASHHGAPNRLPFAWRTDCPVLTDKRAAATLVGYIKDAAADFKRTYELPVVLVWIDALITAAGFGPKEENDSAAVQKVMATLHVVSGQTGTFVAVIDHFGKVAETGTRGSSGKEGSADTVLATLADRELSGGIANSRLAARKQRDGISGFEVPFAPQTVTLGLDEDGDPVTAVVIDWSKPRSHPTTPLTPTLRLLLQVLTEVLAAKGFPLQLEPGGALVQACHTEDAREAFLERYAADGTKDQKGSRRRMAWRRALTEATSRGLAGVRDMNGKELIWRREQ